LPEKEARKALVTHLLHKQGPSGAHIPDSQLNRIVTATDGYSGSDLAAVCQEAALGPIREIDASKLRSVKVEDVRPIREQDFSNALRIIRASVSKENLQAFQKWSAQFGASSR
jgi:SpoVK/Ycf46/Vps4 family AAA+-type ATPase